METPSQAESTESLRLQSVEAEQILFDSNAYVMRSELGYAVVTE